MLLLNSPQAAAQWLRSHATGSLVADSRAIQAGDGFLAWPGGTSDPRNYVAIALQQGASTCLVEQSGSEAFFWSDGRVAAYAGLKADAGTIASDFFDAPSKALAVIAVTGTNGKTSTAWWLAQALSALPGSQALPCGLIGTLGVGRAPVAGSVVNSEDLSLVATGFTTPDPVLLQHTLASFAAQGLRACAMEASSIGLEEQRLVGTHIRVAVFTNFTQDHLDYHGSMDAYWQAKSALFDWLGLEAAIINIDDPQGEQLHASLLGRGLDLWSVSMRQPARLQAQDLDLGGDGLRFVVAEGQEQYLLQTTLIGDYNVSNLLGVIAALRSLGIPLQAAVQACEHLEPVPGRMQRITGPSLPLVAVDYAHTPDALAQALRALRPVAQARGGQLWCVFGCGGERDSSKRPLMGAVAQQGADWVVLTNDNPRSEAPEAIIHQILQGTIAGTTLLVEPDRAAAISEVLAEADAADVVLIAGKGHEDYQETAGVRRPFSDMAQAQAALQRREGAAL